MFDKKVSRKQFSEYKIHIKLYMYNYILYISSNVDFAVTLIVHYITHDN